MNGKLVACLLNISSGLDMKLVDRVSKAAQLSSQVAVLNKFMDPDYNRSVITIAGSLPEVGAAVVAASKEAFHLIDLASQQGGHPRLGAVDLIPLHPVTPETSLEECGELARGVAATLVREVPGSAFFFFGHADKEGRELANRRREVGWFSGKFRGVPDLGYPEPSAGVTGIGAAPYMSNFNISLDTTDMKVGEEVLLKLRERSGGLLGVQGMAFPHQGVLEVACNIYMFIRDVSCPRQQLEQDKGNIEQVMGDFWRTKFCAIERVVNEVGLTRKIRVVGESVIIGFDPVEVKRLILASIYGNSSDTITSVSKTYM